jgi:hypothetical protein
VAKKKRAALAEAKAAAEQRLAALDAGIAKVGAGGVGGVGWRWRLLQLRLWSRRAQPGQEGSGWGISCARAACAVHAAVRG